MADGYISQIKTPDNKVYDFRDQHLKVYTGSCTTAAGTAIKDVTTDGEFTLAKGAVIFVNFSATNTAAVGNLKLKFNGEADTNAKPIKYLVNGNNPANIPGAGYLRANQTYMFQYDGTNWVALLNYYTYSNDFASRIGHYNNILARKAITAESLIVGDATGYEKVASGVTFDLAYPIVWCTAAVEANKSNYANMFLQHYDRNIATGAKTGFTSSANKVIYLIVTINGHIATIDSNIITDTIPSEDNGKVYISLGKLGAQSTGANYFFLYPVHPMFEYKNGKIRTYEAQQNLSEIDGADDLKAIEAISGTSGLLKKTAANTWTLDTNSYVTSSGVTKVSTGAGLTGGDITTTGTVKANLTNETKLTNAATDGTETSGRVYPVRLDKNGKLAVNVPWTNVNSSYLPLTGGIMTGNIRRYYNAASTEPMITMLSNNQDIILWEAGHGTAVATTTTSNHYKLLYRGTGVDGDNSNQLQLIAHKTDDVIAIQIDEIGKITLPQMATGGAKTPIYINSNGAITAGDALSDGAYKSILNNTSKGALGWNSAGNSNADNLRLINVNTLAYWNGAYSGTSSNLSVLGTVTTGTWNASVIGAAYGGTGQNTLQKSANALINALDTGSSDLTANDYVITQYVGGGTTTTSYHRRPASKVVNATLVKAALGTVSTTAKKFLKDTGTWAQVAWGDLTGVPSSFAPSSHDHNRLNSIGRLTSATAIAYNPSASQGFKLVWNIYDSVSRTNDATNSPSFDAGVINIPWDWGGYNGQIAISNTTKDNTRMQIRSANHIDNGEGANPRYTPNYGAWREVVTATKATKVGDTNKPVYINATGQATAISYTIEKSVPSNAVFTDHYDWDDITNKPTTLSGYGIADAKIASGIITLGSNTITPITSIAELTGSTITATDLRTNLGLSAALRFIGKTTTDMSESTTTAPTVTGVTNYVPGVGDVVLDKNSDAEYVCIAKSGSTYTWELLGRSGSWATSTHTHGNITNGGLLGAANMAVVTDGSKKITTADLSVSDSNASTSATTTFVQAVTQNAQGQITVTKASLNTSGTWSGNAETASSAEKLTTARNLGVALGSTTAVTFDGSANQTSIPVSGTLGIAHGGTGATSAADARTNLNTVTGNARVFYGTCNTAAATTLKEVICAEYDKVLTIGDMLIVKFDNTNSGAVGSLQITVKNSTSDSDGTTAKNIKRQYNSTGANNLVATGELNKDSIAVFVYNGTYWILTNADYNNTYSYDWTTGAGGNGRTAETAANGGVGIHRYSLQMMTLNLTWSSLSSDHPTAATTNGAATDKTVATCSFLLDSPIIYQDTNANAIPGNSANVNGFTTGAINLQYSTTNAQWSALTIQKPVYLIGTLQSDGTFKLNATKWWTQTLPTSDDGQIYIFLGLAYNATNIYLHDAHPIYWYKNGEIQPYAGYATATSRAAITTTANAVAYYTNTTGTFGSKASADGVLYATSANGTLQWGTLPIAQGGTGVTSFTKNHVILSDNTNGTTGLTSRAYSDSSSAGALSNTSTNFVTERDVYFGLPTLNNAHNYTSSSTYYAPTTGGTAGHVLIGAGATTAPAWYGGTVMGGSAAASWKTAFNGTTDATATNAAAVTIAGGLGVAKKLYVGDTATVPDLTIGSTNEYGDAYTPIYWHEGVPTTVTLVQQCAFTIKSGMSGVKLSHAAITANSYVTQIVVTNGEANLNSAISWTSASGYIELTCSSTVSGDVTGYIMISRGGEITATATDIT